MEWVKALHIIFMVTWFAGLFYLPRLFVYHTQCQDDAGHQRFIVMERKLFIMMTIGAVGTLLFGLWLLSALSWDYARAQVWLPTKLGLVALLFAYHFYCWQIMREFRQGTNRRGHVFYRWMNEVPALMLLAIVLLVVVKPW